jgi:rhamnosyltransferase
MKKYLKKIIPTSKIHYLKRLLIHFPLERASSYNGKIVQRHSLSFKKGEKLCIFSHFDKDDIIDEYVVYYIKKLYEYGFDVVFVSTSEKLSIDEIYKIQIYCRDVLVKENIGYDFGAWQTGILYLNDELFKYDSLLLCNDSVYAPLCSFDEVFDKMQGQYDFWGLTDSFEIYHHLQSYFMVFNKKIINSKIFLDIWKTYKIYKLKRNIILQYEIGLSQKLIKSGYSIGSYCPFIQIDTSLFRNVSHFHWKELIEKFRCPVLKVELLRENPKDIDISKWKEVIEETFDYDIRLIENHLNRVKTDICY